VNTKRNKIVQKQKKILNNTNRTEYKTKIKCGLLHRSLSVFKPN